MDFMLLKQLLFKDRNLLFAILYQGFLTFVLVGFFELFGLYCVTVIGIQTELFISNIFCVAIFTVFLFQMFGMDANFFERSDEPRKTNKNLVFSLLAALASIILIYMLRFITQINYYLLLTLTALVFTIFTLTAWFALVESNYLVEYIALQCLDDADHARNLAQMNSATSRMIGSLLLSLAVAFNYWQVDNFYLGKSLIIIMHRLHLLLHPGCFNAGSGFPDYELLRQELEGEQRR